MSIKGEIFLFRGFEVGRHAFRVAEPEYRPEQRRADALALMGRIGSDDEEVVVRLWWVKRSDAPEAKKAGNHRARPHDAKSAGGNSKPEKETELPRSRRMPQRGAAKVVGRKKLAPGLQEYLHAGKEATAAAAETSFDEP